ncbi:hypothetical protein I4U23_010656 [Adineta vaga]|nr:hypothetical protein I4U23_010656 [Adineta vaga]
MERILSIGHYPHLQKLIIINVEPEFVMRYFIDKSRFAHIFKYQITHLKLSINDPERTQSMVELSTTVFARIFSVFTSVIELDFGSTSTRRYSARLNISSLPPTTCFSSTIIDLRISVDTFDDCLCLLDGRLARLRRFVVRTSNIFNNEPISNNTILTTMKNFSLTSYQHIETNYYESRIIPLLRRMIYLEELILRLTVKKRSTIIDSTHLNNEILSYLPQLQTFTFNIVTYTEAISESYWRKINQIQRMFYNGKSHELICYIDKFPRGKARSHINSIPYTLNDLHNVSSNFPGGLFTRIQYISLMEIYAAFEHDFFIEIARSFPFLTHLLVLNRIPQKHKQRTSSFVEFSNLTNLTISTTCIDYSEQFLVDTNTRLPRLIELHIQYECLEIVTEKFTRNATRLNCSKIQRLILHKPMVHCEDFYTYFPCCK